VKVAVLLMNSNNYQFVHEIHESHEIIYLIVGGIFNVSIQLLENTQSFISR